MVQVNKSYPQGDKVLSDNRSKSWLVLTTNHLVKMLKLKVLTGIRCSPSQLQNFIMLFLNANGNADKL